ncbi:hypothetical protein [Nocardioides mangrovi]|uniref:Uncharacterized protein n=1 Tax=Nocardioides mangrovi TaxID=2874580 RepID=A0ABS7UJ66_9ACTN|nr:hypothetical protein [Nocardioides mangrovi]MBZ5741083.1 hypothetical protein [Nocardioides mangrovi]
MSASDRTFLVMALVAFGVLAAGVAWTSPLARRIWAPASLALLLAAGATAATVGPELDMGDGQTILVVALGGLLAIAGGGPLTSLVFDLVDRREPPAESLEHAGHVLRGGAWIGGLERAAIYATLVAGWPEGLAIVLAVKGLGRYPELRAAEDGIRTGAAERFIIGTFASVLWACAAAGVVVLVRP